MEGFTGGGGSGGGELYGVTAGVFTACGSCNSGCLGGLPSIQILLLYWSITNLLFFLLELDLDYPLYQSHPPSPSF